MKSSDRQHVNQQLANYGDVMREAFKHMIALKRWDSLGRPLDPQEKHARGVSIYHMARFKRFLQPDDWTKLQRFYLELDRVDMTSSDDVVIDDVLRRVTS